MAENENRPIIIKKVVEEAHDEHHGGAWKVAYADFVTAMMAFFLLLWILSSSEKETLEGLAEHFSPNVTESTMVGGLGPLEGSSVSPDGTASASNAPLPQNAAPDFGQADPLSGTGSGSNGETEKVVEYEPAPNQSGGGSGPSVSDGQMQSELQEAMRRKDQQSFEDLEEQITQAMQSAPDLKPLIPNVVFDRTEEGLRIQIVDQEGQSMFESGSAEVVGRTKQLMALVGKAISNLPNEVIVSGHTDAVPFANEGAETGYGNWELSADRANAVRRIFLNADMTDERFRRVSGLADQEPFKPDDPRHPSNRRISVVLAYLDAPEAPQMSGEQQAPSPGKGQPTAPNPDAALDPYHGQQHRKFDTGDWVRPEGYEPPSLGDTVTIDEVKDRLEDGKTVVPPDAESAAEPEENAGH